MSAFEERMTAGLRYLAALLAAFIASCLTFLLIARFHGQIPGTIIYYGLSTPSLKGGVIVVGFVGVLTAALIAPRKKRSLSAWIFTALGLAVYCWLWLSAMPLLVRAYPDPAPTLPFFPWLLIGGSLCALLFQKIRTDSSSEPLPAVRGR